MEERPSKARRRASRTHRAALLLRRHRVVARSEVRRLTAEFANIRRASELWGPTKPDFLLPAANGALAPAAGRLQSRGRGAPDGRGAAHEPLRRVPSCARHSSPHTLDLTNYPPPPAQAVGKNKKLGKKGGKLGKKKA